MQVVTDLILFLSLVALLLAGSLLSFLVWKSCGATRPCKRKRRIVALSMKVGDNCFVQGVHMSTVVRSDQVVTFKPVFEDAFGNVADELGSTPVWSVSDESIGTLAVSENGMEAVFTPTGKKGTTQVSLLVDADPSAAEEELIGTADLQVLSGKAVSIKLAGVLSDRPAAPVETPAPTPAPTVEPTPEPTEAPAGGQ